MMENIQSFMFSPGGTTLTAILMGISNVIVTSTSILAIVLSERDGKILYNITSVVLLTESLRLTLSVIMYFISIVWYESCSMGGVQKRGVFHYFASITKEDLIEGWKESLHFLIPATLFTISSNSTYIVLLLLDAPTYKLLLNGRIVLTALLFRILMKRKLTWIQYASLIILTCALAVSKYDEFTNQSNAEENDGNHLKFVLGIILLGVIQVTTCFPNIYAELRFKKKFGTSIHIQNISLYGYGTILSLFVFIAYALWDSTNWNMFSNFNLFTWFSILSNAIAGIVISLVLKYSDNIVHTFASALSMVIITLFVSIMSLLDQNGFSSAVHSQHKNPITVPFLLGSTIVFASIFIYVCESKKSNETLKDFIQNVSKDDSNNQEVHHAEEVIEYEMSYDEDDSDHEGSNDAIKSKVEKYDKEDINNEESDSREEKIENT